MPSSHESGVVSLAARVLIVAVLVGSALLAIFKWIFTQVDVTEVLTLIALFSLVVAAALNVAWTRWRRRQGEGQ
ncbi:MAG: hypothetical protein Q8L89_04705 [Gammaproteobacteria bacterium]|nr:hypothetical protein [Gammaproteobacteria bacterium]